MATMTSRQRLMTAMRRGVPDRVPCFPHNIRWLRYHYGCTCPQHQLKLAEDFRCDAIVNFGQYVWQSVSNDYCYTPGGGYNHTATGVYGDMPDVSVEITVRNEKEITWYDRTFHTPAGMLHDVIQWPRPNVGYGDGPNPHHTEPLVKSCSDLEALRFLYPEPRRDLIADIRLIQREIGDRGLLAACDNTHVGGWGLESLGVEERLICSITDPGLLHGVCRITQDVHLRNLRAMLAQGLEVVYDSWFQCGPSVGWSPKNFREFFLPLVKEAVSLVHEFGAVYIYQDDGRMRDLMPMIVEAGADVISGLQPPDVGDIELKDVKARFGSHVALMGGLDPCYTFDRGSPDIVRDAVRQAIRDAAPSGGYILGPAEAPAPETPARLFRAAVATVAECGEYGRDL